MKCEKTGSVRLYVSEAADSVPQTLDEDDRQLQEIIQGYEEHEYHGQITARKSWKVMYQLAESRANIVEWLELPENAKVLEIGAGCGTITAALLKKGVRLTCQEENVHYCRLNAVRQEKAWRNRMQEQEIPLQEVPQGQEIPLQHELQGQEIPLQDEPQGQELSSGQTLTIYAAPFAECEPQLAEDYDVAVCIDVPVVEGKAEQLLAGLRRHLKPDGMLVLAAKNKFGLKYWAGNQETYTRQYFAGLENAGVRLYSGNALKKLLDQTGFDSQVCYYPYPDERFALEIYSDRHLPKKGDLNYNIVNYEDDRILLFDEQKVFDSIIEEGQFPFFANAYLFLAGARGQAQLGQETVYARYATDRSRAHAVCTEMTRDAVYKRPAYAEGAAHVQQICRAYERLRRQYPDTGLVFNRCEPLTGQQTPVDRPDGITGRGSRSRERNGCVRLELLHARALEEQVEQAVAAGQLKKVFDILRRMMQYIRNGCDPKPFQMTEGFQSVFGTISDIQALEGTICSETADIDLILPNILEAEDGTWHVIDYEWTFFFPIPHNFMIYRTLFFLHQENPRLEPLSMEHLLKLAKITPREAAVYAQMEQGFQQYVLGGLVPYREMVNLLGRKYTNIVELKADYERMAAQNELLKGKGIWKAARKMKKKLTGN